MSNGSGLPTWGWEEVKVWLLIIAGLAVLIFAGYVNYYAPCDWWNGSRLRDVPARCTKEFLKGLGQ